MAIALILITVLTSILNITEKSLTSTYKNTNAHLDAHYALDYIKDDINFCQHYAYISGNYYFIHDEGSVYKYVAFVKSGNRIKRNVLAKNSLDSKKLSLQGSNILLEKCDDFNLNVNGNFVDIEILYNGKTYKESIALRVKEYEKE